MIKATLKLVDGATAQNLPSQSYFLEPAVFPEVGEEIQVKDKKFIVNRIIRRFDSEVETVLELKPKPSQDAEEDFLETSG